MHTMTNHLSFALRGITYRGLLAASLVAIAACAPTEPRSGARCPQTYEFGNYGCTVIAGRVLGVGAVPVANALVGPSPSLDGGQFNTPYASSDTDGRFTLRLTRYGFSASDSVSLWIRAATIPPVGGSGIRDSVLVRVRVAPVHTIPDTAAVEITLSIS